MPEYSLARSDGQGRGIFSPREVERHMRIEFERAQRHRFPIVCMIAAIDRLSQLQDLYGRESQGEILRCVLGILRTSTRDSDVVGFLPDDRLLALFPHTPPEVAAQVARKMLTGVRRLRFDRDGRTLGVSLSIGVAHNQHEGSLSFDTLVQVAEEGLAVAEAAGGDRFVETELYQLYERRRRMDSDRERREGMFSDASEKPARPAFQAVAPGAPGVKGRTPAERLIELLSEEGHGAEEFRGLDLDTVVRAIHGLREKVAEGGREADLEEARARIDTLERRIAKLTHVLGLTEEELQRVAAMKGIDLGIASIYRHVQGIAADAPERERKQEMMRQIFQANLEMHNEFGLGGGRQASAQ